MKRAAALGLSFTALHRRRQLSVLARRGRARSAGSPRAAPSTCSTTIRTGSRRRWATSAISRPRSSRVRPPVRASWSMPISRTWPIPSPGVYSFDSSRACRSSPSSRWARTTSSTSPSRRAPAITDLKELEGKTVAARRRVGGRASAIRSSPRSGRTPKKIKYVVAGPELAAEPQRRVRPMPRSRGRVCARSGSRIGSTSTTCSVWTSRSSRPIPS